MNKPILLASTSHDALTYEPVQNILESKDYPVVIYRTDRVLSGKDSLLVNLSDDGELAMQYNETSILPNDLSAAWYRKIAVFSLSGGAEDKAKHLHIHAEIRAHHDTIWSLYPDDKWLNAPDRMRQSDRKLSQLVLAHELGFSIPQTTIASSWNDIDHQLVAKHSPIVVKMIRGIISEQESLRALFTTVLDKQKYEKLKAVANPFPGMYQNFIDKRREWRVTVVGEDVFPASIYTSEEAKNDWRKLQATPEVNFRSEELSDGVGDKCINFLGKFGLKYGAFDFVETSNGEMVFLECNPNGQYGWLEAELGLPISSSIAAELIKIAEQQG